jgi:hypothetical protein
VSILVIVPQQALDAVAKNTALLRDDVNHYQQSNWALVATGRVVVGGAVVIIGLLLLWLQVRRPRRKTIRAQKLAGGEARITVDSIAQRLAYNIDQLPDVVKVTPRISGRGQGVDIDLLLETTPDIDVPMKTAEVMEVTREVIVERMGLKLGKVNVQIKHAPYPKE